MLTAILATLGVFALLAGLILGIRRSAKTGLPPAEVVERASKRARELDTEEQD